MTITPSVRHAYTTGASENRLHCIDFGGTGRPLIALHGVTGNAWNWYKVAEGLADRRHVYALDFRGYGESQWSSEGAYTTTDHVADLGAFIDSLEEQNVDLIGSSWGALVAIQYAAENPDRVGQLVVVDVEASFATGETDLFPRPMNYLGIDEIVAEEAKRNPHATPEMIAMMAATCYTGGPEGTLVPKHDPYFFGRWPFRSDDHWERLEAVAARTLLLHAADSFVNGAVMEKMANRIPDAHLIEISDSGHAVPLENPTQLVAATTSFLE
ncbi:MAG: alpha/beta hydrolase [Acidimicrobiia bacterium]|nr:alpha/beta hydrolase [Acidimicrobiia bacterium]